LIIFDLFLTFCSVYRTLGYSTFCYFHLSVIGCSVILALVTFSVQFLNIKLFYVQLFYLWLNPLQFFAVLSYSTFIQSLIILYVYIHIHICSSELLLDILYDSLLELGMIIPLIV
jgi:hypothetical protein